MAVVLGLVDDAAAIGLDKHLLAVHLVLRQVLDVGIAEVAQSAVQGDKGELDAFDLHALHQFARKVQAGGRCGDGSLVTGKDALEILQVFGFRLAAHESGQRGFAQGVEGLFEFIVVAVVEKSQGTSAAGRVVDDFGHDGLVFAEVKFVADTDFACGVYEYVPQAELLVEFAEQEDFDACVGLFLFPVEACGEDLGIVEHEDIVFVKVVQDVLEGLVFDFPGLAMEHHHAAFVAVGCRVLGDFLLGKFEFELGKFHDRADIFFY